jgi:hypothetical protein
MWVDPFPGSEVLHKQFPWFRVEPGKYQLIGANQNQPKNDSNKFIFTVPRNGRVLAISDAPLPYHVVVPAGTEAYRVQ